jgi:hypothetical protein
MHHFYVSSCRRAGRSNLTDALIRRAQRGSAGASCSSDTVGAAQAALLQWVAVLFMIFQAPSMRSSVCRSTHPSDRSSALLKPRRTEAISPAWVTEITLPTIRWAGGVGPFLEGVSNQALVQSAVAVGEKYPRVLVKGLLEFVDIAVVKAVDVQLDNPTMSSRSGAAILTSGARRLI